MINPLQLSVLQTAFPSLFASIAVGKNRRSLAQARDQGVILNIFLSSLTNPSQIPVIPPENISWLHLLLSNTTATIFLHVTITLNVCNCSLEWSPCFQSCSQFFFPLVVTMNLKHKLEHTTCLFKISKWILIVFRKKNKVQYFT